MSFKNEFTEVYNYLSAFCKEPTFFVSEASESDFLWKDDNSSTGVIIKYVGDDSVVKVPNGVIEIGSRDDAGKYDLDGSNGCFEGCEAITHIILPNSLKIIGNAAFFNCGNLTSINIPDSVTSIGHWVFEYCVALTSVTFPNSVKSLGDEIFSYCSNLTSIVLPDSLKNIGIYTFMGCCNLGSITIPDSVTSIGSWAFKECTNLTSIIIPSSVTSIGMEAFFESGLESITCPKKLDLSDTNVPSGCKIIRR